MAKPYPPLNHSALDPFADPEEAERAFAEGRIQEWLVFAHRNNRVHLVYDNHEALRARERFEEAVYHAYINADGGRNTLDWQAAFLGCDREILRAISEPVPVEQDTYTLYRGVSGRGRARQLRGLSWTGTFTVAQWFALRFDFLSAPMVLEATVPDSAVLAYTNDREEDEYIVQLPHDVSFTRRRVTKDAAYDAYCDEIQRQRQIALDAIGVDAFMKLDTNRTE